MAKEHPSIEEVVDLGKRKRDRRLMAEAVIVLTMLGGFVFMLVESADWDLGAALFPRISGALGIAAVLAYAAQRLFQEMRPGARSQGRLLDIGWAEFGGEKQDTRSRAITFVATTGGLWIGIWLVGFHIAVPVYLMFMLIVHGRVRWYWAAAATAGFYGLIMGVYDELLHTSWNDPLLFDLVRSLRAGA